MDNGQDPLTIDICLTALAGLYHYLSGDRNDLEERLDMARNLLWIRTGEAQYAPLVQDEYRRLIELKPQVGVTDEEDCLKAFFKGIWVRWPDGTRVEAVRVGGQTWSVQGPYLRYGETDKPVFERYEIG